MTRSFRFSIAARIDYREAVEWYEKKESGLGDRFATVIASALERISQRPEMFRSTQYSVRDHAVRRLVVRRFPFVIYFYATEVEIVVIAIFHTSRNPRQLAERNDD